MSRKPVFVLCLRNSGYEVALEPRKIYEVVADPEAEKHEQIRVVDESGEDYLYPASYFAALDIPTPIRRRLSPPSSKRLHPTAAAHRRGSLRRGASGRRK